MKDGDIITLTCINPYVAHWGDVLIPGQQYIGLIVFRSTEIITDYENYWKYNSMVASSITWIRKGYDESNLHEVMPGYKPYSQVKDLYTKRIDLPYFQCVCSDNHTNFFCLLSDAELYSLGAAKGLDGRSKGKPSFSYTVYRIDDYFDYTSVRRDDVIKKLLNL